MNKRILFGAFALAVTATLAIGGATTSAQATISEKSPMSGTRSLKPLAALDTGFEVYYHAFCKGAGRYYAGANAGEAWVNDTFNNTNFGTDGYGQKILNNAASVFVYTGTTLLTIKIAKNGYPYEEFRTVGCHTLQAPNSNIGWAIQ